MWSTRGHRPSVRGQLTAGSKGQSTRVSASTGFGKSHASALASVEEAPPPVTPSAGLRGTHRERGTAGRTSHITKDADSSQASLQGCCPPVSAQGPQQQRQQRHLGSRQKCAFSGPGQTPRQVLEEAQRGGLTSHPGDREASPGRPCPCPFEFGE